MLRQQIADEVVTAMKKHDTVRLGVLRYILSEIKNKEIDLKHELNDDEALEILRREVKRRTEAIEQFKKAGRTDIVENEQSELKIIETFLPQQMSDAEVEQAVDRIYSSCQTIDFGSLMKSVMQELKGKADGKIISQKVRQKLGLTE